MFLGKPVDPTYIATTTIKQIDKGLVNVPLSSGFKRAVAAMLDIAIVMLFTKALILVCVIMLVIGLTVKRGQHLVLKYGRLAMYVLVSAGCTVLIFDAVTSIEAKHQKLQGQAAAVHQHISVLDTLTHCTDPQCVREKLLPLKEGLISTNLEKHQQQSILHEVIDELALQPIELSLLKAEFTLLTHTPMKALSPDSKPVLLFGKSITLISVAGILLTSVLYSIISMVWFDGQTLGKQLLSLKVARVSGEPISWQVACQRYLAYWLGILSIGIGFVIIFKDKNRQMLQDKLLQTVVLDLSYKHYLFDQKVGS